MPVVPRQVQPRVGRSALPGVHASPEAFASAQPIDTSGVQRVAVELYQRHRQNADQVAVLDADTQLTSTLTGLLYDPDKGVLNRRGKDVLDAEDEARETWRKATGEIESRLTSDVQRMAFKRAAAARTADLDQTVMRHVSTELDRYDKETTASAIKQETQIATAQYQDMPRVQLAIDRIGAWLTDHADRNGLPTEWLQERKATAASELRAVVVTQLLATGRDMDAKAYFDRYRGELVGDDLLKAEAGVDEGSLRGASQRASDAIIAETPKRADALAAARKITDPELRDEVQNRVNHYFDEEKRIEQEKEEDRYLSATNLIDLPKNRGRRPRDVIPPSEWAMLPLGQREALERRAEVPGAGNDDRAWLTFLALPDEDVAAMGMAEFQTKYWSRLDPAHRSRAETMWKQSHDARGGGSGGGKNPEHVATLTFKDLVDNGLRQSGFVRPTIEPSKFSKTEVAVYAGFEKEAARRIEALELTELQGKRKASVTEMQKIVDAMVLERVSTDRGWRGRDRDFPAAGVPQDDRGNAYIPIKDIPAEERAAIERVFREAGRPIDTKSIERAWAATLMRDRELLNSIIGEGRGGGGDRSMSMSLMPAPLAVAVAIDDAVARTGGETEGRRGFLRNAGAGLVQGGVVAPMSGVGHVLEAAGESGPGLVRTAVGDTPPSALGMNLTPPALGLRAATALGRTIIGSAAPTAGAQAAPPPADAAKPARGSLLTEPAAGATVLTDAAPKTIVAAIARYREGDKRPIRIPAETENLDLREAILREFLDHKYSLAPGKRAEGMGIVKDAQRQLARIEGIRAGRLKPSAMSRFIGGRH